jgi:hypothetical protein
MLLRALLPLLIVSSQACASTGVAPAEEPVPEGVEPGAGCRTEACEDAERAQSDDAIETGIVGVVAYRSDSCGNDCCECQRFWSRLLIFKSDKAVVDGADARKRFEQVEPLHTLRADMRYAQALEPGRYVACDEDLRTCANLELAKGEVFTLNLQAHKGPLWMRVFDAKGARHKELVVGDGAAY